MRLLNTKTLALEEFFDSQIPSYAILSHRWGEKEVTYKQMYKTRAPKGPGLTKIKKFCALAARRGFEWAWIDTCCIDKKSSAELSEAINSMYRWYEDSSECYNYLADVGYSRRDLDIMRYNLDQKFDPFYDNQELSEGFRNSTWFTRGWTLQELLASSHALPTEAIQGLTGRRSMFFDADWNLIGNVDQLKIHVAQITGIKPEFLLNPWRASVAQKMSWVSRRQTSRGEDMAYCLLGLFDVNMPLLYGEGAKKAFSRLQQEIMKISDDESLFAWTMPPSSPLPNYPGMLASHPVYFTDAGNIVRANESTNRRPPYWVTNKGLRFEVPVKMLTDFENYLGEEEFTLYLNCCLDGDDKCLGILTCGPGSSLLLLRGKVLEIDSYTVDSLHADLKSTHVVYLSLDEVQ